MSTLKAWISAFRLRTLPLATAAVLTGMVAADQFYRADSFITLLSWLTAIFLQILSNLANDYGDFTKGTDNENRIGNTRALQSGIISPPAMLRMIVVFVGLCLASGIALLWRSTSGEINLFFVLFFLLGVAAIAAAIKYTVGKNAYGYSGLGDVFVLVFFGPVAVVGTFLLNNGFRWNLTTDWPVLAVSLAIGLLSAGVLNVNNIRDIENDRASGKFTIPVKIGLKKARVYHVVLMVMAVVCTLTFVLYAPHPAKLMVLIPVFILFKHVRQVWTTAPSPAYNALLKQLSLTTLLLALCLFAGNLITKLMMMKDAIEYLNQP